MQVDSLFGKGERGHKNPLWLKESQFFKLEIVCSLLFSLLNLFCLAYELVIKMAPVDC